jgi:hypothetical protein
MSGGGVMAGRFQFIDRWQTSLADLFDPKPSRANLLALLEVRDRQLEDFLAGPGWEDYTPVHSNLTVGDGVQYARKRVWPDGTVDFWWRLEFGASSSIGGSVEIGLPVAVRNTQVGTAHFLDNGTRHYVGVVNMTGSLGLLVHSESGNAGVVNASAPFTFVSGDRLNVAARIEPEDIL